MHAYVYYYIKCVSAVLYVYLVLFICSIPTCTIIEFYFFRYGVDGAVMLMECDEPWEACGIYMPCAWLYMHSCSSVYFGLLLSLRLLLYAGDVKSMLEERKRPTLSHYFCDFKEDSDRTDLVLRNAKYILLGVLSGLEYLHSRADGIMHRDIKC